MERQALRKKLLKLAIPMMIQYSIGELVGLVDNIMVGSLGTEVVTAVSISCQLCLILRMMIFGATMGAGVYVAQYYGKGDVDGVQSTVRFKAIISVIMVLLGFGVCFIGADSVLRLYLTGSSNNINTDLILRHAKEYLWIYIPSIAFTAIQNLYATSLRETGDSIKAMVAGVVAVLSDVVLNYILIFGKFGLPRLGIKGAALASLIAGFIEVMVLLTWVYRDKNKHKFVIGLWRTLKIPKSLFKEIFVKSIPLFLNEVMWSMGVALRTQILATKGVSVIAAEAIETVICDLFLMTLIALGNAVGIIVGQTLGTGDSDRAKKYAIVLTQNIAIISVVLTIGVSCFADTFTTFYSVSNEVKVLAANLIKIMALLFIMVGVVHTLYCVVRAGGNTLPVFLFDSLLSYVFSLPMLYLLCTFTTLHITALYAIYFSVEYTMKIGIFIVFIKKGVWIKNLVHKGIKDENSS